MPYGGGYSYLSSKNNQLIYCNFIKNPKKGAILIEFAFAVPILFSLIYYIQDLATIKRWHSRLDFSLHCAANMFQNTQNITRTDFARIAYAGAVGLIGEPAKYFKPSEIPLVCLATCITGTDNNKCKINWFAWSDVTATNKAYDYSTTAVINVVSKFYNKRAGFEYSVTELCPELLINTNETKIILEMSIYKTQAYKDYYKNYFGLFITKIPLAFTNNGCQTMMNHYIIFTPKPGTFDPNNPPP